MSETFLDGVRAAKLLGLEKAGDSLGSVRVVGARAEATVAGLVRRGVEARVGGGPASFLLACDLHAADLEALAPKLGEMAKRGLVGVPISASRPLSWWRERLPESYEMVADTEQGWTEATRGEYFKTILFIAPSIYPVRRDLRYAGIERLVALFANELAQRGFTVYVAGATGSALHPKVWWVNTGDGQPAAGDMEEEAAYYAVRQVMEREKIDVVHDFSHRHLLMRRHKVPGVAMIWHDPRIMTPPVPGYNVATLSQWQADRFLETTKQEARALDVIAADTAFYQPYFETGLQERRNVYTTLGKMGPTKGCVLPGEMVTTARGQIVISDVRESDRVLTHVASMQQVSETMRRDFAGDIVLIENGFTLPLKLTPEHPVLTFRYDGQHYRESWVRADSVLLPSATSGKGGDWLAYPVQRYQKPVAPRNGTAKIRVLDALSDDFRETGGLIYKYGRRGRTSMRPIPTTVSIDSSFALLAGYYIAEGSASKRGIVLDFHAREEMYRRDVLHAVRAVFGLEGHEYIRGNKGRVQIGNAALGRLFPFLFGKNAHEKRIPNDWLGLPNASLECLARGIWRGDGSLSKAGNYSFGTVSRLLATQLQSILARLGVLALLRHRAKAYFLTIQADTRQRMAQIMDDELPPSLSQTSKKTTRRRNKFMTHRNRDYVLVRPQAVKREAYSGPVHNLEVLVNHSYTVNGLAVHNCLEVAQMALHSGIGLDMIGTQGIGDPPNYLAQVLQVAAQAPDRLIYRGEVSEEAKAWLLATSMGLLYAPDFGPGMGESHLHKCIDAAMAGTPSLLLDSGAYRECIEDGVSALFARDMREMQARLGELALLDRRAVRAWAVRRYDIKNVVDRWMPVYEDLKGWGSWS